MMRNGGPQIGAFFILSDLGASQREDKGFVHDCDWNTATERAFNKKLSDIFWVARVSGLQLQASAGLNCLFWGEARPHGKRHVAQQSRCQTTTPNPRHR